MSDSRTSDQKMRDWPKIEPFTFHEAENAKLRDYWREFAMACHERLLLAIEAMGHDHGGKFSQPDCPQCEALAAIGEVPTYGVRR